ncbi:MAG: ADP-ribosylglycohydrolase family protein [Myxococcaceae bacterium]
MPPPPRPPKRKAPGLATATEEQVLARSRGALLGLAVGDAFGTTNEGKRMQAPPFPLICEGVHTEMRGRGPFELRPGQVTDDTQLATVLAEGLREWRQYDWVYTAKQYGKWLEVAFDCDAQVRSALEKIKEGRHPEIAGRQVWLESSQRAASNASLTRGVPLAVYFARDRKARIDATLQDAQTTHYSPHCQLAGVVLNAIISAAITTPKEHLEQPDAMKAIESELSIAAADLGRALSDFVIQIKVASDEIRADIAAAQNDDPLLYGPEVHMFSQDKWVRVALRLALWELWHAPNYEAALIDVANRGADADTNCAVTGALFGAVFGEGSIPERWATPVLEVNGPGPLFRRYHPRELMLLAQNLPKPPEPPKAAAAPPKPKPAPPSDH